MRPVLIRSMDVLQITPPAWGSCKSAKIFPGKEISLALLPSQTMLPRAPSSLGWQSTGAASQECCQLCSSALCQKQIRKPAVSSGAQSQHGEMKGLCKAEINFWQRMFDIHELLKLLDIKSTGLFYYRRAQLAGFLCCGN